MPRDEGGVELYGVVDPEIRQAGTDPRLVDDAVAPVVAGQLNVRLERVADELRLGDAPAQPGEDADVPALDEAEAPRPARDLGDLPREEVPPLLAVELRRLREEERLAGQVHAVAEDVRGDADVGGSREEPVDLLLRDASGIAP